MTDIRRIGESGVHTVEGTVAGNRAAQLNRQREAQRREYEAVKNKIKEENAAGIGRIDDKFSSASDRLEQEFRRKTVGLVSADEFRKARESVNEQQLTRQHQIQAEQEQNKLSKKQERELKRKKIASSLSFGLDDEEDEIVEDSVKLKRKKTNISTIMNDESCCKDREEYDSNEKSDITTKPKASLKNPSVDTSFLPDARRDADLQSKRAELQEQWLLEQQRIKDELLEVVYSYWDGSGHRKTIMVRKGTTIGKFLESCKQQLIGEFHTLRSTNPEDMVYVKEDLIIPHHYSFYDLIVTKARGKSGPLFHFDVHDDIRLINDATVEKDESHPGKVAERRWYERNKHIFPASRWEVYDPKVNRENMKYTIHGGEVESA